MPTQEEDYIPFGEEWEKSVMRIPKATIVKMYRKVYIEKLKLEERTALMRAKVLDGGNRKEQP